MKAVDDVGHEWPNDICQQGDYEKGDHDKDDHVTVSCRRRGEEMC